MLRPGSAIKRKTKPQAAQIALKKQVSKHFIVFIILVGGTQIARSKSFPEKTRFHCSTNIA